MRNLKRALSLGLASSMVLSTTAFTASAALAETKYPNAATTHYTDNDQLTQTEKNAIFIANEISLMSGISAETFGAGEYVERSAMAIICARLTYGDNFDPTIFPATNLDGTPIFNDVDPNSSIAGYVAAAYTAGLVAGVGNGNFDLGSNVILADGLVMILRALGYLQEPGWSGDNYKLAVARQASQLGLINLDTFNNPNMLDEPMTREEIAVMLVKALTDLAVVDYSPDKGGYHNRFNANSENTVDNTDYISTLGWENFKLRVVDSTDDFNRPSEKWVKDNYTIANYTNSATWSTTEEVTVNAMTLELNAVIDEYNKDEFSYGIYVDGIEYSEWYNSHYYQMDNVKYSKMELSTETYEGFVAVMNSKDNNKFLPSGNGALTEIFISDTFNKQGNQVTGTEGNVTISTINTHLARVDGVKENADGTFTTYLTYYEEYMQTHAANPVKIGLEYRPIELSIVTTEAFEQDAKVAIKATGKNLSCGDRYGQYSDNMEAISIEYPATSEGSVTETVTYLNSTGGNYFILEGDETINFNIAMRGDLDVAGDMSPDLGANILVYKDEYGNALGYEEVEETFDYLYVEGVSTNGASYFTGVETKVTFANGEEAYIQVSHVKTTTGTYHVTDSDAEGLIPGDTRLYGNDKVAASANENFKVDSFNMVDETAFENRIFKYSYNETTGQYTLTSMDKDILELENGKLTDTQVTDGVTKGDIGIFTSVRYADGVIDSTDSYKNTDTQVKIGTGSSDDFQFGDTMMLIGTTETDSKGDPVATAYGTYGETATESRYGFVIQKGYGVYAVEMEPENATAITYTGVYTGLMNATTNTPEVSYEAVTGYRQEISNYKTNYDQYAQAFRVDSSTIFVDVVANNVWTSLSDVSTMDEGDVNMQVLFGANGYADIVFINHATGYEDTSSIDGWDYFILKNSEVKKYYNEDSEEIWEYNVYVNGIEEPKQFYADNLSDPLEVNVVYSGYEDGDGVLVRADELVRYEPLTTNEFNESLYAKYQYALDQGTATNDIYNNNWAVVSNVGNQAFSLLWDDNNNGNKFAGFEGVNGVKHYTYTADTKFVEIRYNKVGEIDYIKPGNSSSLTRYDRTSNPAWVDVVRATSDSGLNRADLVIMLIPYDDGVDESYSNTNFELLNGLKGLPTTGTGAKMSDPIELLVGVNQYAIPSQSAMFDIVGDLIRDENGTLSNMEVTDLGYSNGTNIWAVDTYSSIGTHYDTTYYSFTYQYSGLKYEEDGTGIFNASGKNTNGYDDDFDNDDKSTWGTVKSGWVRNFAYWDVLDLDATYPSKDEGTVVSNDVTTGNGRTDTLYDALYVRNDSDYAAVPTSMGLLKEYYDEYSETDASKNEINSAWAKVDAGDFLTTATVAEAMNKGLTTFSAPDLGEYVGVYTAGKTSGTAALAIGDYQFYSKAAFLALPMYQLVDNNYGLTTGNRTNFTSIIPAAVCLTLDLSDFKDDFWYDVNGTVSDKIDINDYIKTVEMQYLKKDADVFDVGGDEADVKYYQGWSSAGTNETVYFYGLDLAKSTNEDYDDVLGNQFVVTLSDAVTMSSALNSLGGETKHSTLTVTNVTDTGDVTKANADTTVSMNDAKTALTVSSTIGDGKGSGDISGAVIEYPAGVTSSKISTTVYKGLEILNVSGYAETLAMLDGEYEVESIFDYIEAAVGSNFSLHDNMYIFCSQVVSTEAKNPAWHSVKDIKADSDEYVLLFNDAGNEYSPIMVGYEITGLNEDLIGLTEETDEVDEINFYGTFGGADLKNMPLTFLGTTGAENAVLPYGADLDIGVILGTTGELIEGSNSALQLDFFKFASAMGVKTEFCGLTRSIVNSTLKYTEGESDDFRGLGGVVTFKWTDLVKSNSTYKLIGPATDAVGADLLTVDVDPA